MSFWVKSVIAIVLIGLLSLKYDFNEVFKSLKAIHVMTFVTVVFWFYLSWIINTIKWRLLWKNDSWLTLLFAAFISQFYGLLLPGQLAGEAAKAYRLGRGRKEAENIAASVFVDRIIGVVALLCVTLGGVLLTTIDIGNASKLALALLILLLIFGLYSLSWRLIFLLISRLLNNIAKLGVRWQSAVSRVMQLLIAWQGYLGNHRTLFFSLILGVIFQLLCVWINVILALDLGISLAFVDWCWIIGIVSVAVLLPVSIGGVGVREVSYVGVLAGLGVPAEQALALSLAIFALSLLGATTGGIIELLGGLKRN